MVERSLVLFHTEEIFRQGLVTILERQADIRVAGSYSKGTGVIEKACELKPDLVIVDTELSDCEWVGVAQHLRQLLPDTRVILLAPPERDIALIPMIKAGVRGFFSKGIPAIDLVEAIHLVADGKIVISPPMIRKLLAELDNLEDKLKATHDGLLTEREKQVLTLVSEGKRNRDIAATLFITNNTAKAHLRKITAKLHVRGRAQAVATALEKGMLLRVNESHQPQDELNVSNSG